MLDEGLAGAPARRKMGRSRIELGLTMYSRPAVEHGSLRAVERPSCTRRNQGGWSHRAKIVTMDSTPAVGTGPRLDPDEVWGRAGFERPSKEIDGKLPI
jgi:hypothetical protein